MSNRFQFLTRIPLPNWRRWLASMTALVATTLVAWVTAALAVATPAQAMPPTPMPDIVGCSAGQADFLKKAWVRAHEFAWRSNRVLAHIQSQSESDRAALWNRDLADSAHSPAVARWFGAYGPKHLSFVARALHKAELRFEQRGSTVEGIRRLRCGSPQLPSIDVNADACPGQNPGAEGPPSAYHFPVGTVVTCPAFWDDAFDGSRDAQDRLDDAARRLVHETMHWLSVDGHYVVDRHIDGIGGLPDGKYYGIANATKLAREWPQYAIVNNDNYAWFAWAVGRAEPTFTAVYAPQDGAGTGALYLDQTWASLVERWKALRGQQYLADIETYVVGGERRYLGVWRVGPGNGALFDKPWSDFEQTWRDLRATQDLIDIETYGKGSTRRFVGVWRDRTSSSGVQGGLLVGLSWQELVDRWQDLASTAWLSDLETYVDGGERKYIGVWQPGADHHAALFRFDDGDAFDAKQAELRDQVQLVDYERYQDADGGYHFIGVWKGGGVSGSMRRGMTREQFLADWQSRGHTQTLVDVEIYVPLAAEVK